MTKVLFIGNGLTTAAILHYWIARTLKPLPSITIYDAASPNNFGGRMLTDTYQKGKLIATTDLGAQYLTRSKNHANDLFDYLEEKKVIHRFDASSGIIEGVHERAVTLPHYRIPNGFSSIGKALLDGFSSNVVYNRRVSAIDLSDGSLVVTSKVPGAGETFIESFDYVISTLPAPYLKSVAGNFQELDLNHYSASAGVDSILSVNSKLNEIVYSNRFALALYFYVSKDFYINHIAAMKGKVKYIYDNPIIRYVSFENWKDVNCADSIPSIDEDGNILFSAAIHTTIDFGKDFHLKYLDGKKEEISQMIYHQFLTIFPSFSSPSSPILEHSRLLFWKNSQMLKGLDGKNPGNYDLDSEKCWIFDRNGQRIIPFETKEVLPSVISHSPLLIITGEMFTESNFEGCVAAAQHTTDNLLKIVK
jgi:hypothetical protein